MANLVIKFDDNDIVKYSGQFGMTPREFVNYCVDVFLQLTLEVDDPLGDETPESFVDRCAEELRDVGYLDGYGDAEWDADRHYQRGYDDGLTAGKKEVDW